MQHRPLFLTLLKLLRLHAPWCYQQLLRAKLLHCCRVQRQLLPIVQLLWLMQLV
jgi:hypothetical protein